MKTNTNTTRPPEFFTIATDSIICPTPRAAFDEAKIAAGAALIAANGGLPTPLLLTRGEFSAALGDCEYHLVSGALAYWAAVAYGEANPKAGECVNAMVVGDAATAAAAAALFA